MKLVNKYIDCCIKKYIKNFYFKKNNVFITFDERFFFLEYKFKDLIKSINKNNMFNSLFILKSIEREMNINYFSSNFNFSSNFKDISNLIKLDFFIRFDKIYFLFEILKIIVENYKYDK